MVRRVLVTGASGFIGGALVPLLLERGDAVHAVSRRPRAQGTAGVRWLTLDLGDAAAVERLVAEVRPDLVYHLASLVSGARGLDVVLPAFQANLAAAVHLLVAAAKLGTGRVVLAGSLEEPEGDAASAVPASPYAAAKWAQSGYARMLHALYSTPVVIARIFMVYGPGRQDEHKLVPYVIQTLLAGKSPQLSSGKREVDWIYVDDVARGLVALGAAPGLEGATLDLGTGRLVSVRDLVERLGGLVDPAVPLEFAALADRPLERVRAADAAATRARSGFAPEVALEVGLERTVSWFRARRG